MGDVSGGGWGGSGNNRWTSRLVFRIVNDHVLFDGPGHGDRGYRPGNLPVQPLGRVHGGIEQHRVFTENAALCPTDLQQKVQKRFAYRFLAGDADIIRAGFGLHYAKVQFPQEGWHRDAGAFEGLLAGEAYLQALEILRRRGQQLYSCIQGLIQARGQLKPAETEGQDQPGKQGKKKSNRQS